VQVRLADSFEQALQLKHDEPSLLPIAGGTDLLVHWPSSHALHDRGWLDLSGLAELRRVHFAADRVEIGALVTYWDVIQDERFAALPLLPQAALTVGAVQIQTRGTWAGNIANASPAADGVPVLMAYDAEVCLASANGRRVVPLASFYHGYKQLESRPDELIETVRIPLRDHDFEHFTKVGSRAAQAITKVGVAMAHSRVGWRVVANSLAPSVCRCSAVEAMLTRREAIDSAADLLPAIRADVSPIDDIRSTARYREHVFSRVLYPALADQPWREL